MVETLDRDNSNYDKALMTGMLKGGASYGIEKMTGGNILGKGSLDDFATNLISNSFKGKGGQWIASKIYEVGGEIFEENIENGVDMVIDNLINNKGYKFEDWWSQAGETTRDTFLSTVVLNLLGLGGNTYNDIREQVKDNNAKKYINEAQKIIDSKNIKIDLDELANKKNNITNLQQNQANNQSTVQTQRTINQNSKMAQNENMGQTKQNIINNKVGQYINEIKGNFNSDININTNVVDDGRIPINYEAQNQRIIYNKAKELFSNISKRVFKNNNEDIYVTNTDISKSISETIRNKEQKQYVKENVAVFSQLDKIIENAEMISSESIDNKGRSQYSDYQYYVSKVNIDGKPYVVEFDTRLQEGTTGKKERHFRLERVYPVNNKEVVSNTAPKIDDTFLNETTSQVTSQTGTDKSINQIGSDVTSQETSVTGTDNSMSQFVPEVSNINNSITPSNENVNSSYSMQNNPNNVPTSEEIQKNKVPIGSKVQAHINMEKFKKANNIKGDIISETTAPVSEGLQEQRVAKILSETPEKVKEKDRKLAIFKASVLDKGIVFEELSLKTKNRDLQGKWDYTLSATARGQNAIGNARYDFDSATKQKRQISKSLEEIKSNVGDKIEDFSNYMYHQLNIDRMTLEERFGGDTGINYERKNEVKNKPVFGESVTADVSQKKVAKLEQTYPEFKSYAQDVYDFLNANMKELVDNGVVSKESADYMANMYPHYVPIGRANVKGNAIDVPLDTGRTGVNTPIKSATGGNGDILPLFDTIAQRTLQTYRASARNNFGVELKNTLNTISNTENVDIDTIVDTMGQEVEKQELLQEGKNGNKPTFTVFENAQKITYEITKDMYDALKPVSDSSLLGKTITPLNKLSNFRRGVLTEYNPLFMITNAVKDGQDVLVNSQHAAKTYAKFPEAYAQIVKKGYWYQEYVQNGGEQNSYFNANDNIFESDVKKSKLKGVATIPLRGISNINNVIELAPRLAEYIASRESGRSVETSMLDASRVTTNFKASGDVTKFINRNGGTFLNASVQGAMQQVRNIREAHAKGLKGYAVLAAKYAIAGLPALILNNLVWSDDEDYDELQDYAKDNYYCIAKYGDGDFIRIPKGRMLATIQKIATNASEYITDKKEINIDNFAKDFWEDLQFTMDNVAPNNPLDNNVISPIMQAITNTSWHGGEIVPSRLQDKPKAEQYDETTDSLSIWLGQKLNASPYKINYLLDQYFGGISDVALPMMTKQAENNPIEDKFTTNSIMKSKYPGEFFEKIDELKVNSNSEKATDEDKIKYKYMSNIQKDMSDLYEEKRKIQNSNLTDEQKKEKLKEVQKRINKMAKDGLNSLYTLKADKMSAEIGNTKYYKYKDEWQKLSEKEEEKNKNISLKSYADYKDKVYKLTKTKQSSGELKETQDLKDKDKIQILLDSNYSDKEISAIYENYILGSNDNTYKYMKVSGIDIKQYLKYQQQEFASDKKDDGTVNGKSISGSKQKKVVQYLNSMDINGKQRLLLYAINGYKTTLSQKNSLVEYVQGLKLNPKDEIKLYDKFSGFKVYKNGKVEW